jgi:hypothetical protein
MVDMWSGMEIGGEAVVAGCCGEELLLLWCSLEAGVDGPPSLLLFVGLAAGVGSAERGKNGGRPREPEEEGRCWEQGSEQPREGKVPAAVMAGEEGAAERERGRGEVALCGEAVRGERQRWKVQWWWLKRRRRWESLLGAAACAGC